MDLPPRPRRSTVQALAGDASPAANGPHMGKAADDQPTTEKGGQVAPPPQNPLKQFAPLLIMLVPIILGDVDVHPQPEEGRAPPFAELRNQVKRGDQVVTIGGMHCEVVTPGEGTVDLRLGSGNDARWCASTGARSPPWPAPTRRSDHPMRPILTSIVAILCLGLLTYSRTSAATSRHPGPSPRSSPK